MQGWGGVGSGRVVLIDNGRVYQSKAADALVQVKTTKFGTNVGLNMLLNISSRYFGGLFWSRQLRGLPSSDGYFFHKFSHMSYMGPHSRCCPNTIRIPSWLRNSHCGERQSHQRLISASSKVGKNPPVNKD